MIYHCVRLGLSSGGQIHVGLVSVIDLSKDSVCLFLSLLVRKTLAAGPNVRNNHLHIRWVHYPKRPAHR